MANKSYEQRVQDAMREHDLPRDLAERYVDNILKQEARKARIQAQPTQRDTNALLGSMNVMYN